MDQRLCPNGGLPWFSERRNATPDAHGVGQDEHAVGKMIAKLLGGHILSTQRNALDGTSFVHYGTQQVHTRRPLLGTQEKRAVMRESLALRRNRQDDAVCSHA
jgi:hypothetical protein